MRVEVKYGDRWAKETVNEYIFYDDDDDPSTPLYNLEEEE